MPYEMFSNTSPTEIGLLKYSPCAAFLDILDSVRSMSSSEFFSGHVEKPFLSRMFTMSQESAISPALTTQQSLAMMFPQKMTSVGSEMERVGYSAFSHQSQRFWMMSGFLVSSSVSKSSTSSTSGRMASLREPRGDCPAPSARNETFPLVVNSSSVHEPGISCLP